MIDAKENYNKKLAQLKTDFAVSSVMALPKITKVVVSAGVGSYRANKDMISYVNEAIATITGQKPMANHSRKAIAGFKLRENEHVGYKVTLRGTRMNDFISRLINITLPRIRDFRGIDQENFDARGNLNMGFRDQQPFAELGHQAIDKPFGIGITFVITNSDAKKSYKLLQELGFPMKVS